MQFNIYVVHAKHMNACLLKVHTGYAFQAILLFYTFQHFYVNVTLVRQGSPEQRIN